MGRDATNSQSVAMGRPTFAPKLFSPVDRSPNPTTCLIPRPIRLTILNQIRIQSAVLPQCTGQTYAHTDQRMFGGNDR